MELLPDLLKAFGPSGVFLFMLWRLWNNYTSTLEKLLGRYDEIITENTRVQALVVKALERLADKG